MPSLKIKCMRTCEDEDTDGSVENAIRYLGTSKLYVERKYDGSRTVVEKFGNSIKMIGKSEKEDYAGKFPTIVGELKRIPYDYIFDCELTYFHPDGRDELFTCLSGENGEAKANGLTPHLMIFDMMWCDRTNITRYKFGQRRELLEEAFRNIRLPHVHLVESQFGITTAFHKEVYEDIISEGGEGIVLKLPESPYISEDRKHWAKVKHWTTTECAVCGVTEGTGARKESIGALILAQRKGRNYVHVGNVNVADTAERAKIKSFVDREKAVANSCGYQGKGAMKFVHPKMVVEVKILGRQPRSDKLRQPIFLRMRDDKRPDECELP
jgi:bifunctional non-homologous end joining protein LigD